MMNLDSRSFRFTSSLVVLSMLVMSSPLPAFAATNSARPEAPRPGEENEAFVSRPVNSAELALRGKADIPAQNPYTAGSQKFAPQHKGVDLLTGNFSMSATDLSFEGGFGVPVAVTRSYSLNNADEGPFGPGWTLSADIRTTAGGLLQSPQSPIRSVPVAFKERPGTADLLDNETDNMNMIQFDPSFGVDGQSAFANQPVEAVIVTDSAGRETTIQRDADGILTTPPWDNNQIDAEYTEVQQDDKVYRLQTAATIRTPEGTIYQYGNHGYYTGDGMDNPWIEGEDPVPSNILKIDTITDRHGNVTTFSYANSYRATYQRLNGTVTEDRLTSVTMPGSRSLVFVWTEETDDYDRIVAVYRGGATGDTVDYEYNGNGYLTSVTSLGGKETSYTYAAADDHGESALPDTAPTVLRTITDPRGLTTTLRSCLANVLYWPYEVEIFNTQAYLIAEPSGVHTYFQTKRTLGGPVTGTGQEWGGESEGEDNAAYFVEYDRAWDDSDSPSRKNHAYYRVELDDTDLSVMSITNSDGSGLSLSVHDTKKQYVLPSQYLVSETNRTYPLTYGDSLSTARLMKTDAYQYQDVTTARTYNFMASPLSETVTELTKWPNNSTTTNVKTVEYAYWDKSKYYQRKATRVQTGSSSYRYSFTDYFDDTATDGKKGLVYRVYDAKYGGISPGATWRTTISASGNHAAEFDYDGDGRPTSVKKLQTTSPAYVETLTTYGSNGPSSVTEDYGSGKINRVTTTDYYDVAGRATQVTDAAGRTFVTVYNLDGQVTSVTQTDVNPDKDIVTYTYGTSGISNGMVTEVYDKVGNVKQTISYVSSGNGVGQVSSVDEDRFGLVNSDGTATYAYTARGDRSMATLVTPNGTEKWGYSDYIRVGNPEGSKFAFRTLTKLESDGDPTAEEFHYHFDSSGRLNNAAFAQTSQNGSAPFYGEDLADRRARAYYLYEPGGRLSSLEHYWENRDDDEYAASIPILGQGYSYDAYKGLRTSATYYHQADGDNDWETEHTENYAYEAERDFLTGVHYTGGTPGTDWSYDPAGNRANSGYTYDNLNRILASPNGGGSYDYDHDILGFRTWRNYGYSGVQRYLWDEVGRLKSCVGNSAGARYEYRADGMRIKKVEGLTIGWNGDEGAASGYYTEVMTLNAPTERYWYDGQMAHEEDRTFKVGNTTYKNVTKYGLGARGIDYMSHFDDQTDTTTVAFPIYDGHGNMIATLARSGSTPYYSAGNLRLYDVWGSVRSGSSTGLPNQRYCANLGHRQDDESGLVYMRARYYEPSTGRFVSEDPVAHGSNWYIYATNSPTMFADLSGHEPTSIFGLLFSMGVACGLASWGFASGGDPLHAIQFAGFAVTFFGFSLMGESIFGDGVSASIKGGASAAGILLKGKGWLGRKLLARFALPTWTNGVLGVLHENVKQGSRLKRAEFALMAVYVYSLALVGALVSLEWD